MRLIVDAAHRARPDNEQVARHPERIEYQIDLRAGLVRPVDRHLSNLVAAALRHQQDFYVEAEAIDAHPGKQILRGGGAEQLESALRVLNAADRQGLHQSVEGTPDDPAIPLRLDGD